MPQAEESDWVKNIPRGEEPGHFHIARLPGKNLPVVMLSEVFTQHYLKVRNWVREWGFLDVSLLEGTFPRLLGRLFALLTVEFWPIEVRFEIGALIIELLRRGVKYGKDVIVRGYEVVFRPMRFGHMRFGQVRFGQKNYQIKPVPLE